MLPNLVPVKTPDLTPEYQVLSPFMTNGSLADTIVTLRDANGKEEDVMIRLAIVSADMPQAPPRIQIRPGISGLIRPHNYCTSSYSNQTTY